MEYFGYVILVCIVFYFAASYDLIRQKKWLPFSFYFVTIFLWVLFDLHVVAGDINVGDWYIFSKTGWLGLGLLFILTMGGLIGIPFFLVSLYNYCWNNNCPNLPFNLKTIKKSLSSAKEWNQYTTEKKNQTR